MKVFVFQGGLGNQIFEYAYYQHELKKNPHLKYLFPRVKCHNGFELDKWFDVKLNEASSWQKVLYELSRRLQGKGLLRIITDKDIEMSKDSYFAVGYIQTKQFLENDFIRFRDIVLSDENLEYCRLMESTESVAIHIRRGDYLQAQYKSIYGGICTEEYYQKALAKVTSKFKKPSFFVFSNDPVWVRENLQLENAYYINCNTGANSPLDMYLMSKAKAVIMANSTFSYWGAKLNRGAQMVIYPKKWINSPYEVPDIFESNWIGL